MLLRTSSESNLRPIRRLTAKTVASGFVMAWRFAICPTRRSPASVNPTIEGVVRLPSELGMTTGSPPSMTATQLLVVPRSMPITLGMEAVVPPASCTSTFAGSGKNAPRGVGKFGPLPHLRPGRFSAVGRSASFGHHHRSRAHEPIVELVTLRHLGDDGARGLVALLLHQRFVHGRIERLSHGGEPADAVLGERGLEELLHQPHAVDHLAGIVLLGVIEGALQVVHHGQEVLQQALDPEALHVLLLLQRALLEVVELRGGPEQPLMGVLEAIARVAGALERLFELRFQLRELLPQAVAVAAAAVHGARVRNRPLLLHRCPGRDLRIVWNQVVSSKGGGNIAQRSGSPRGLCCGKEARRCASVRRSSVARAPRASRANAALLRSARRRATARRTRESRATAAGASCSRAAGRRSPSARWRRSTTRARRATTLPAISRASPSTRPGGRARMDGHG